MWLLFLLVLSCARAPHNTINIRIDGSSTVFPITEAVAEEFQKTHRSRVTIGVSGTGGGFRKFCTKTIGIAEASRTIKPAEKLLCEFNHVDYIELPIAYDGIVIVVHPQNNWVKSITVQELKKLWGPSAQGKITKWNQIRSDWPNREIHLFAPGVDSGTYDYFTEVIVGKAHSSRGDVTSSEDDNVLVQGISTDRHALGFLGLAYYSENKDKLKALAVEGVMPNFETILSGQYKPLSRHIFLYVDQNQLKQKDFRTFVDFYFQSGPSLIREVGYVPLSESVYQHNLQQIKGFADGV